MRLQIEHSTIYRYHRPLHFGPHRLVLRPREGHDLRIDSMRLELSPAYRLTWVRDVFGNSIALVDWLEAAETLVIQTELIVERLPPFPARDFNTPSAATFPPFYDSLEAAITTAYQRLSYEESRADIQDWLTRLFVGDAADAEGSLLALCQLVHRTITYRRRHEQGVQTPRETLERGSGSCRDMATLMMEAARCLGVAARFASGYLHGTASMAGQASMHAWCEVYLPLLGWRGFDPTIGAVSSLRHIVTGVSEHPRGVMPVSGTFHGTRADCRAMEVAVKTRELPSNAEVQPA